MNILPSQFTLIKRSLDLAARNHEVVSRNIANINTPGYRTMEVDFDASLDQLARQGDGALERAKIVERPSNLPTARGDRNDVDMDRELGKLEHTALMFRAFNELLTTRLEEMRGAMQVR